MLPKLLQVNFIFNFIDGRKYWELEDRTAIAFSLPDRPGVLLDALQVFTKNRINMTSLQSKPQIIEHGLGRHFEFFVDFEGKETDEYVQRTINELKKICDKVTIIGSREVPWFPTHIEDFDFIGKRVLSEGDGIQEADHPGFRDPEYRKRRDYIS